MNRFKEENLHVKLNPRYVTHRQTEAYLLPRSNTPQKPSTIDENGVIRKRAPWSGSDTSELHQSSDVLTSPMRRDAHTNTAPVPIPLQITSPSRTTPFRRLSETAEAIWPKVRPLHWAQQSALFGVGATARCAKGTANVATGAIRQCDAMIYFPIGCALAAARVGANGVSALGEKAKRVTVTLGEKAERVTAAGAYGAIGVMAEATSTVFRTNTAPTAPS